MKKNLFILTVSVLCLAIVAGCDKKRGCTDNYSDNFDPEAVQDDDTCIPTREKFVGEYDGFGTIEIGPDTLVSYDQVVLNFVDTTAIGPTGLIIGISNFDVPLVALSATVTGTYELMVNNQVIGVYNYWGDGNINGEVVELDMIRTEEITLPDASTYKDTILLHVHGIKRDE